MLMGPNAALPAARVRVAALLVARLRVVRLLVAGTREAYTTLPITARR